jgi:D-glycero-alpha-D-manno-heptose-7-phosphate kinase
MALPPGLTLRINVFSHAPPGASMGTSAAVSVAMIGALDVLTGKKLAPKAVATLAHSLETKELGLECGVQDQLASAFGGINLIEISDFPHTTISPLAIADDVWWELEHRLVLTYIGQPHQSSEIHRMVIAGLGANPHQDPRLERLRQLARQAGSALPAGNFAELGRIFDANTEVQRSLHKNLVCDAFEDIISVAQDFQALGCKVNGAGGDGGSIAILTNGDMSKKRKMQKVLEQKGYQTLPIYLSRRGLRVWKSMSNTAPGLYDQ